MKLINAQPRVDAPHATRGVALLFLTVTVAMTGCRFGGMNRHVAEDATPADFALVCEVHSDEPIAVTAEQILRADPTRLDGRHVLLVDRTLRSATGDASRDYFPPVTRTVTREQYRAVYRHVRDRGLIAAANRQAMEREAEPREETASQGVVRYVIRITANGKTRTLLTTPEAMPSAQALLRQLIELRRVAP